MTEESATKSSGAVILKIVWVALLLSQLVFVGLLKQTLERRSPPAVMPNFSALQYLSIVLGAVSIVVFRKKLSRGALTRLLQTTSAQDAVGKVLPWSLMCWALNEGVMMFGFVHGFLAADFGVFMPTLAVSVILQLVMYPRLEGLIKRSTTLVS